MAMARDGKMFSGRQAMLSHERKLPPMKGAAGGAGKLDPLAMPGGGGDPDPQQGDDSEDPAQVVAQHGPANRVEIMHDHAAGKHHVHSEHEDGHATESDHGSADEAGDHAKALGASPGGEEQPGGEDDGLGGAEYE